MENRIVSFLAYFMQYLLTPFHCNGTRLVTVGHGAGVTRNKHGVANKARYPLRRQLCNYQRP